jgi:UDP-N-acetylmuramate dehydrogenase
LSSRRTAFVMKSDGFTSLSLTIAEDVPLAPLTTLGVGGPARYFVTASSEAALIEAVAWAETRAIPLLVLGGGSNVVVADHGFQGLVVRVAMRGVSVQQLARHVELSAAAGEPWDDLVRYSVAQGWAGFECLSGIPGLVGATPIQNVGAYGQEVSESIRAVRVLDLTTTTIRSLDHAQCGFGYRDSVFKTLAKGRYVVLAVTYRLTANSGPQIRYPDLERELARRQIDAPTLQDVRQCVLDVRRSKSMLLDPDDPNHRSCGSFFVNPVIPAAEFVKVRGRSPTAEPPHWPQPNGTVKLSAAWLIEHAGFRKGVRFASSGLSSRHSLAVICHGAACAGDVVKFARQIRARVAEQFGIELIPEPAFWGFGRLSQGLPDDPPA